jgi:hypothetical protein
MSIYAETQSRAERASADGAGPGAADDLAVHASAPRDVATPGTGNLRERMTGIYHASLAGFKTEVLRLMSEERWAEMRTRGLDADQLKRRKNQVTYNPLVAKDRYYDPGDPLERKDVSTFEAPGPIRTKLEAEQTSRRTVGDLVNAGAELPEREERFMDPDPYSGGDTDLRSAVDPGEEVTWKEGGTYGKITKDNKWVKKCQGKLHLRVLAGPAGTALRMLQAWELVGKPAVKEDYRLAQLGWMITSNDHRLHEIQMTSAEYGMCATRGLEASRHVALVPEDELRAIAAPGGFPDEANDTGRSHDGRIAALGVPRRDRTHALVRPGADYDQVTWSNS